VPIPIGSDSLDEELEEVFGTCWMNGGLLEAVEKWSFTAIVTCAALAMNFE
jgi:hypothetical protein